MNDLDSYIASGIIEAYCLGNLPQEQAIVVTEMAAKHPEIRAEIDRTLAALERYPGKPVPKAELKNRVLDFLDGFLTENPVDLQHPPVIDRYSDPTAWSRALDGLEPEVTENGMAARVLAEDETRVLSLVWLSGELVEDMHTDDEFRESFLILEGACECDFGGVIARFGAGDYFDIPPHTPHTIRNISENLPYVKGLVQRLKAA
ncbi:MAG: cupin domain-containing protein [Lewinellaceae bacterium]|nr:cupin domain-containing protein [Lewinellaceae bacterium]